MKRRTSHVSVAALFVSAAFAFGAARPGLAATHPETPPAWDRMGLEPWPSGMMGVSLPRHRTAMLNGVPAPYAGMQNPLPHTRATIDRGRAVYAQNCVSCHGERGTGDGIAARELVPHPAYLALLSQMPIAQWDSFMVWTVAEGGKPFGSAMPAFRATLSKDDTWAVIAYIQAHLPRKPK